MLQIVAKSILLLLSLVVIICGIYPFAVWLVGQTFFPFQANGSILFDSDNKPIGSKLIAQPFTRDEYFQPRPSAASYDAAASASSSLAVSNYVLRDRVARSLGSLVKYYNGQAVGPDIEKWFQEDTFQNKPNIVAQWAILHPSSTQAWVNANPIHIAYVTSWAKRHPIVVAQFVKDHLNTPAPKPTDLAVVFFQNFSKENPGKFPSAVNKTTINDKTALIEESINTGSDIQSIFFDMWRQDHPDDALQEVPGDLVTSSASGLDPHITLQNAEYQLDRVAAKWASYLQRNPADLKREIKQILDKYTSAPFGGLAGEKFVNVLEVNLELHKWYGMQKRV